MLKLLPEALRALLKAPATLPHPATPRRPPPGARGELHNDMDACIPVPQLRPGLPHGLPDRGQGRGALDLGPHGLHLLRLVRTGLPRGQPEHVAGLARPLAGTP